MRATNYLLSLFALLVGATGCGGSKSAAPVTKVAAEPATAASDTSPTPVSSKTPPAATTTAKPPEPAPAQKPAPRKTGLSNLFRVPEIPQELLVVEKPVEKKAEAVPAQRPKVRLLGFARRDGDRKALVEFGGEVHWVTTGDEIDSLRVVEMIGNQVTFQYAAARWTTPLFQQDWVNEQSSASAALARDSGRSRGASSSRTVSSTTRPTSKSTRPLFSNDRATTSAVPPAANSYQATGGNIPGIPGVSGQSTIPGMPAASGGSSSGAPGVSDVPGGISAGPPSIPSTGAPGALGAPGGTTGAPGGLPGSVPAIPEGIPGGVPGGVPGGPGLPGGP